MNLSELKGTIKIIVKTNAPETKILGYDDNKKAYRVAVKAKPENNEANREIIKFFTKLTKKKARIKTGFTSKEKLITF